METVALFSPAAVNSSRNILSAIERVVNSYHYILGEEVVCFEKEFSQYIGVAACVTVGNGTDALELSLKGLGVSTGDHVATAANAGFYSSTAIYAIGAIPLYIDIDDSTLTMSVESLRNSLKTTKTRPKAVIVTHLYGQLAPHILEIKELCQEAGIALVEDCAQATGAFSDGKKVGSFGKLATFSFYPTKNLGAFGDGGAITTNDDELAQRLRSLRQYGWSEKYHVALPGGRNSRMDEIQAAILREKLPHLDECNKERREIAARYSAAFNCLPLQKPISLAEDYVAHLYVVRTTQRDDLRIFLKDRGVATEVHYPIPDHLQSTYQLCSGIQLPVTELACQQIISLPCYPGLRSDKIEQVISAVEEFFGK